MEILFSIKAAFAWMNCKRSKKCFQPVQWLETAPVFAPNEEWRKYDTPTWLRRGVRITGRKDAKSKLLSQ
ncbi:MAG: hypothetical protein IPG31_00665 [Nitrosomonas sp.]|nr:hypothetical protein [Nitrosomonas sp.]